MNNFKMYALFLVVVVLIIGIREWHGKKQAEVYISVAHLTQGIREGMILRMYIEEYVAYGGSFPSSNKELQLPEPTSFSDASLKSAEVIEGGIIKLTFTSHSGVDGGIIRIIPSLDNKVRVQWSCETPSYKNIADWFSHCSYIP